jgi:hypothetical protein
MKEVALADDGIAAPSQNEASGQNCAPSGSLKAAPIGKYALSWRRIAGLI